MTKKELEELIYEFGHTMKMIGKAETDDKTGMKEYIKLVDKKEKIMKQFDEYFKNL